MSKKTFKLLGLVELLENAKTESHLSETVIFKPKVHDQCLHGLPFTVWIEIWSMKLNVCTVAEAN